MTGRFEPTNENNESNREIKLMQCWMLFECNNLNRYKMFSDTLLQKKRAQERTQKRLAGISEA